MINSYLSRQITQNFPHNPTEDQFSALKTLTDFLLSVESDTLLLLKDTQEPEKRRWSVPWLKL